MLEFEYPWVFILLLVPAFVWLFVTPRKEAQSAVRTPFFDQLVEQSRQRPSQGAIVLHRSLAQQLVLPIAWILLVASLARPVWVGEPILKTESARDLLLSVDLSGSMDEMDFADESGERITRLDAVKQVLDEFITRREGDRIGLEFFGTAAFLQTPFTLDHDICRALLEEAQVGMAGLRTKIGDAIGLAIKLFEQSEVDDRVVILLTDGNDTGSKVAPNKAAEIAADHNMRIHTIAMGDPETIGENTLDEDELKMIADITGGLFYRAMDRQELASIYAELDEIEPLELETISFRPKRQLFFWPLGAALVLLALLHLSMVVIGLLHRVE